MPQRVRLYTLSTCSHCKAAKKFLNECSIPYEATDVDQLDDDEKAAVLQAIRKINPRCTFPTLIIGDKVIVGYRETEIREALGLA